MAIRDLMPFGSNREAIPYAGATGDPFEDMRRQMNRLFDDMWRGTLAPIDGDNGLARANVDVSETEDAYEVKADLPGLGQDDIDVSFADGLLTIRGEQTSENEQKDDGRRYHLRERHYASYRRSFNFGNTVDPDAIKADFSDGVLTVTLPKSKEAASHVKKIAING